jgi:signal peptidase I
MADEQRELATESDTDPATSPDPEVSAVAPAIEPIDSEADTPLPLSKAAEPAASTQAPATEVVEAEASGTAPVVESVEIESSEPIVAAEATEPQAEPTEVSAKPAVTPDVVPAAPTDGADALISPESTPAETAVEEEHPTKGRRAITFFREFVETILLTLVIFVAVRTLVVNFRVDGESMHPTLLNGEYLLVNRATYFHFDLNALRNILPGPDRRDRDVVYLFGPPRRGDIIVFEPPIASDKPFVKRVIGLPGDTIAVRADHLVYVNGQPLEEHYIAAPPQSLYPPGGGTYTVPPGMIFVMGDNRNNSEDSRFFSAVSLDSVIGKAIISYWPPEVFGFIPHVRYALVGNGN